MSQKKNSRQSYGASFIKNAALSCTSAFSEALKRGLDEDGSDWDWTSLGTTKDPRQILKAVIIAKSPGVWAGEALVAALQNLEPRLKVKQLVNNGTALKPGMKLLHWEGPARELLALERPFLNLASYVGGIATQTDRMVKKIRTACPKNPPRLTSTRKTLPGYRDVGIYGVIAGGGLSHRVSLSGGVLIKENHIAAAGSIGDAIQEARAIAPHGLLIEVEVRDLRELDEALEFRSDAVLLDNFSPKEIRLALKRMETLGEARPWVEVSGGINEDTVSRYAISGVDILSSGSLTHSVTGIDLSLLVYGV